MLFKVRVEEMLKKMRLGRMTREEHRDTWGTKDVLFLHQGASHPVKVHSMLTIRTCAFFYM